MRLVCVQSNFIKVVGVRKLELPGYYRRRLPGDIFSVFDGTPLAMDSRGAGASYILGGQALFSKLSGIDRVK